MNLSESSRFDSPLLIKDRKSGVTTPPPLILCGNGNLELGRQTSKALGDLICERNGFDTLRKEELQVEIFDNPTDKWPDQHIRSSRIKTEMTGRYVVIFNNPWPQPDKRLMETFFLIDAARTAGAGYITVVLPYFAYGRGDKKAEARTPIEARVVARVLEMLGSNRIITLDLHAEQTTGSVLIPWDNLYSSHLMIPEIKIEIDPDNAVYMSTDTGGLKRADAYNKRAEGKGIAFEIKARKLNADTSDPEVSAFVGNVDGRDVVIIDDESVSFSSIYLAAMSAVEHGARSVIAVVSHLKDGYSEDNTDFDKMWNLLNGMPSQFRRLITTDTVDHLPEIRNHPLVKIIPTANFFAEIIWRNFSAVSLSPDLID
ncbi:hypothetical protein A2774_00620 [Candidatus Roizmanbacteria bacterium RIFCSPHIGHO2_01_FULL_39_12c]|uniref:ribose-phosphate diphosphokinase n=1 Tax=Candidatus Roizmanbacteria bacterium RIFCSPHIGHO2_01_FULL_39_12c TaxID=1802031 RepID=A0A1F7GA08_9BACT|nr:MAG: hypothetical protein A2774_00620 [Candidatus Roizmanbacteria bacterium RIFCSPHIGHO2_01_FULL_39_12c]OGK47374.1 MAG: hypothetical protein A2963_04540 [Candidatus Roizmanbacteria bacterium RIFCSPLOWO2_01_FULL_40_13]